MERPTLTSWKSRGEAEGWVRSHLEGWQGCRQHPHPPVRCSWGKLKVEQIRWKRNCSAGSPANDRQKRHHLGNCHDQRRFNKGNRVSALSIFLRINHKLSTHLSPWSHLGSRWVYIPVSAKATDWYLLSAHMLLVLDKRSSSICQSSQLKKSSNINRNTK